MVGNERNVGLTAAALPLDDPSPAEGIRRRRRRRGGAGPSRAGRGPVGGRGGAPQPEEQPGRLFQRP